MAAVVVVVGLLRVLLLGATVATGPLALRLYILGKE
jgi:hypothetical protein